MHLALARPSPPSVHLPSAINPLSAGTSPPRISSCAPFSTFRPAPSSVRTRARGRGKRGERKERERERDWFSNSLSSLSLSLGGRKLSHTGREIEKNSSFKCRTFLLSTSSGWASLAPAPTCKSQPSSNGSILTYRSFALQLPLGEQSGKMSGAGSGDASFASQPSSEYTVESSRWLTAESSRWPTATAMYGVDSSNEDDPEYIPSEENEEDDASTSDHNGYSTEEQNDEYVDGRRNEEEHFQLQLLGYEYHSQYENSDEEVRTPRDSEDELGYIHTVYRGRRFDAGGAIETIKFQVGMKFESASEFTTAVRNYAIWNGFNIRFIKSEARKVQVACDRDCPWRMYGSLDGMKESFVVKTLNDDHTCSRVPRNIQANHKWIVNHFLEKF